MFDEEHKFSELVGKTLKSVNGKAGGDEITFFTEEGEVYRLYHSQVCCESVTVEDIVGDLQDLIGSPILMAWERQCSL